jgi:hypothetical protein
VQADQNESLCIAMANLRSVIQKCLLHRAHTLLRRQDSSCTYSPPPMHHILHEKCGHLRGAVAKKHGSLGPRWCSNLSQRTPIFPLILCFSLAVSAEISSQLFLPDFHLKSLHCPYPPARTTIFTTISIMVQVRCILPIPYGSCFIPSHFIPSLCHCLS